MTFVEACKMGYLEIEDIEDFIEQWHENPKGQSLLESLGMTREEFKCWVHDDKALTKIVFSKRT